MSALVEKRADQAPSPDEDQIVALHGATWADYQRLLAIRGESSVPRLTYLEGRLEIMTPSRSHEKTASRVGRLVEVYCLHVGIEFEALGSWTLEKKEAERGAEPDECYLFGDSALLDDPEAPQLAIEVEWSRRAIRKLEVYRKLAVAEVWIWHRRGGRITVHLLQDDTYVEVERSHVLPDLDLEQLASFLDRPTASAAIRDYRAALSAGVHGG
jgi:Uma2 family endonuclease